jgi:hypothetical protein
LNKNGSGNIFSQTILVTLLKTNSPDESFFPPQLDKLIEEQKNLLTRLEEKKSTLKPEEKSQMIALIKSLTTSIEKAKEDLQKLMQTSVKRRSVSDVSCHFEMYSFNALSLLGKICVRFQCLNSVPCRRGASASGT